MDKQPNISALLIVNFILHFISACMAGVWISEGNLINRAVGLRKLDKGFVLLGALARRIILKGLDHPKQAG